MPSIFCPTCDTLILAAAACPACGWQRPLVAGAVGQRVWQAELGRALPKAQASAVLASGYLCLCAEDGAIAALHLASGETAWQQAAPTSQQRMLASDGARLLVSPIDLQPIPTAHAALLALDLASGGELWRHPTTAHSLSAAAVERGTVYFTTSAGQLHALDAASGAERWAVAHESWGSAAPAAAPGLVVAGGRDSTLRGYADTGAPLWRWAGGGAFAGALCLAGDALYTCGWDGRLYVFDAQSGTLRWQLAPERGQGTTSPPTIGAGRVFVGSRVYRDPSARTGGTYALLALDASTGAELWRYPTPRHIVAGPAVAGGFVLAAADDGVLRAIDAATGAEQWQLALDSRPVLAPQLDGDMLYVGQRDGTITAVRWRAEPAAALDDPLAYRQRGELEQAAVAHALCGALEQAAAIYAHELGQPRHAAQLYERAEQYALAAQHWEQAGEPRRAREQYERAGSALDVARLWAAAGEPLQGARLYEQHGELVRAAELYEQAGGRSKAGELYEQAGRLAEARRIWQSLGAWERLADALVEDRQLVAAADLLAEHRQIERAADLYEQAGQPAQALSLRAELGHWERVAVLAQQVGDHAQAGAAYERLGQTLRAAEAFQHAAEQLVEAGPIDEPRAAGHYQRAAQLYAAALDDERAMACRRLVRRYRHQPEVIVTGSAQQVFVEHHWNTLLIRAENAGHGPAFAVEVALRGAFDVDGGAAIAGLRVGEAEQIEVYVRPHQGEYGPKVPLVVALTYADAQGQRYQGMQRIPIHVVQQGMSSPTITPVEIRVEDDQLRSVARPTIQLDPPPPKETPMADQEAITQQERLLSTYRRTLAHQLQQKAQHGAAYAPPGLLNGIEEARAEIARIKAVLQGWGVAVEDAPDDGDASASVAASPAAPPQPIDRRALREAMAQLFSLDELATLCDDIQQDLAANGIRMTVSLEEVGGSGKEGKIRELIGYLDRRGYLHYLVAAVRKERPGSL